MTTKNKASRKELLKKYNILKRAAIQLKKEFIGINDVIDEIIESISSWYLFPEMQEKPLVVNLWGLTGVGKTSLIIRIAELIQFGEKCYYYNLGEESFYGMQRQMQEIHHSMNGDPVILVFDEFQNARSVSEEGSEIESASARLVWQLMDSGKFQTIDVPYNAATVDMLISHLKYVTAQGVKVKNGKVTAGHTIYIQNFSHDRFSERPTDPKEWNQHNEIAFVPEEIYPILLDQAPGLFFPSYSVAGKLNELDAPQTIDFLSKIYTRIIKPSYSDFSKSIIFNIGNLDEAYQMSSDLNPDMNADEFHEQSLKINIPQIKNVLKKRFRNEQIARLGNNHIIYRAFNSSSFKQIISLELKRIAAQMSKHHNISLSFDQSIHDLIYSEGVYPTQGTRPVFSTIQYTIKNKLARLLSEIYLRALPVTSVNFANRSNEIRLSFFNRRKCIHTIAIKQEFSLFELRKNKSDDLQAIIAVHEAGHAVISAILLHTIPEIVFSTTASQEQAGFIYSKFKWKYISRKEILSRLALYFGGLLAEKLVFGEDNITAGANDDIFKATSLVNSMLKEHGMGKRMASVNTLTPMTQSYLDDFDLQIDSQARQWINEATELAENTLRQQEKLLLSIAGYLSDHASINKEMLRKLVEKHAVNFNSSQIIEEGSDIFYRRHLRQKINGLSKPEPVRASGFELQLNNHKSFNKTNQ